MISDQHTWNILGDHFKRKGFVHHQTESFDHFLNVGIPKIVTEEPDIVIIPKTDKDQRFTSYRVSFSDIHIPSPTVTEETRELRGFYPSEARQRDLTYDSPIYATVTETLEVEGEEPEVNKYLRVVLGRIPIMLRSSKCYLTNMTPDERIAAGECEYDEGGYFIVKGKERVLVAQLRGVYNIIMVLEQKPDDKMAYIAEMRSMSEETGHSVLVRAMIGSDDHTLNFQLPYVKDSIPMGVVFKAMGYRQEQFADLIGLSCNKVDKYIRLIVNESFFVEDDGITHFTNEKREEVKAQNPSWRKEEVTSYLTAEWENMDDDEQMHWQHEGTKSNALRYIGTHTGNPLKENERRDYAMQVVDGEIFPHMGVTSTTREKAYLLGHMVHKLLATRVGLRKPDDRDNYINKRVDSPGILCHDLFRQLFKKYTTSIVSQIEKRKQLPDAMSIIPRQTDITKGFNHCFGTGNWGIPKNSYVRPGVAQILSRLSYGATLSNIRRISIPVGKESKNAAIRQINPSQIMFICPAETPEGAPVGIVLNLSLLTRISERTPTVLVKEVVELCENITLIGDFDGPNEDTKVFLNGIILGMTEEPYELVEELKTLRNVKMLPWDVSISYDDVDEEIHICSDEGRLLRPVFTVKDRKLNAEEKDGTNWDELVESGAITYIDNMEANGAVIAFHQKELGKYHNDYCEIAAAMMLGVMASIIPFPDHSQSPRNCYQAAMGKQAMSMFALSHLIRTDTVVHVLSTPQRPLVSTRAADMMGFSNMPSGVNCVVAIACYTGFNQEDSVILNHSAIQRGLFWATTYRTHSEEEKKQGYNSDKIGVPPLDKCRGDANYGLLDENGVVRLRHPIWTDEKGKKHGGGAVCVQKGDVIIGKVSIKSDKSGKEELTDCSVVIKKGEEGYIDRIFTSITPNGYKLVKVVIRKLRIPEVGDKFASRAAQKGTVGMVYRQEDMPWTQEGIVPDIIINPHAIPSRMTINQLMESVLGKSCAIEGCYGDATPFTSSSVDIAEKLCERLGMNGYERTGREMLYNGMTGDQMGMFFIGPVYYQRLKHLVSDKVHARATGPVTTLTRQPLEGRSRDGGEILTPQWYLIVLLVYTQ
jgi:DNA-directed RNA polymerase II subunit RPB2